MKALSIRQPWAWLIVNGHKDIENRSWPTRFRGEFLVHASQGMTRSEYDDVVEMLEWPAFANMPIQMPDRHNIERGGIVGIATVAGCVSKSESPWFFGPQGFLLRDAKTLPFIPFKGMLGFFDVPADVVTP